MGVAVTGERSAQRSGEEEKRAKKATWLSGASRRDSGSAKLAVALSIMDIATARIADIFMDLKEKHEHSDEIGGKVQLSICIKTRNITPNAI